MTNQIKFTDQELAEIRMLQGKYNEKIWAFGQFRMERMSLLKLVNDLEEREKKAEEEFTNLQSLEASLLEKLTKKYGEGQLSLTDGVFIPSSPPAVIEQKEKSAV